MDTISVGILCSVVGLIVSFMTYQRNGKREIQDGTKELVELKIQLEYISRGIDDIRDNDKLRDKQIKDMNDRLLLVENECKILSRSLRSSNNQN